MTEGFQPIAKYGPLADCDSAALVDRAGSIDWLCLPRCDSDAVFARLLDPDAGHWSIRPVRGFRAERRYLPGTLVIETTFTTDTGSVRLLDALAFAEGQRGHELGFDGPHELLRTVEGVSGSVELRLELAPRPEYGLVKPLFRKEEDGGRTFGGVGRMAVRAGVPVEIEDSTMRGSFAVSAGETLGFSLRWAPPEERMLEATPADRVRDRLGDVVEAWRSWEAEHDIYEGPHRELVRFSSRVLKGLTLGDARRPAPPPLLQGDVLDRARPRGGARAEPRRVRQGREMGGGARGEGQEGRGRMSPSRDY